MPRGIRFAEINHHEVWTHCLRQCQQTFHFVDALVKRHQVVVIFVIDVGTDTLKLYLRSWPIDDACIDAVLLRRNPDRFTSVESPVELSLGIAQAETSSGLAFGEVVGNDAMMIGDKARSDGIVVGECLARIRRTHTCIHTSTGKAVEERCLVHQVIIPAESVHTDHHQIAVALWQLCRALSKNRTTHQQHK